MSCWVCCGRALPGHALIGARQRVPREQIADPVRSLVMGLPLDLAFRTKGQLAIDLRACLRTHVVAGWAAVRWRARRRVMTMDHGPVGVSFVVGGQPLVVADGAAMAGDPGQGPLHDPPAGQHLEGVQVRTWHRAGFDTQAITRGMRSPQRHAALCPGTSRCVPARLASSQAGSYRGDLGGPGQPTCGPGAFNVM
jgi:hypothetical protein